MEGVRELRSKIHVAVLAGIHGSAAVIFIADAAHNLPFLHACGVLNDVLEQLAKEQPFSYQGRALGLLVAASETVIPWIDLPLTKEAVQRRNDLTHHAVIVPRDDCWKYIDAIEAELVHWRVISPP